MKIVSHVVELKKEARIARIVASFENPIFAEIAERAMNEAIQQSWYNGNKSVVYCWVPADRIVSRSISYGYLIVE